MRISDWSSDVCSSDLTLTGRRYLARQREAERRALPRPAFGTDHSAMALDDALDRRQADAVAVELLLVVQALERTEQLAGIFGREAGTVVGDVERQLLAGHVVLADDDACLTGFRSELPRVADPVLQPVAGIGRASCRE